MQIGSGRVKVRGREIWGLLSLTRLENTRTPAMAHVDRSLRGAEMGLLLLLLLDTEGGRLEVEGCLVAWGLCH